MSALADRHQTLIDCAVLTDALMELHIYIANRTDWCEEDDAALRHVYNAEQAVKKIRDRAKDFRGVSTTDPPPAAPLTAEEIAAKRAYAVRVYSYPRTVDEPFYVCRDAVRLADECTALRDRLARAEERGRELDETVARMAAARRTAIRSLAPLRNHIKRDNTVWNIHNREGSWVEGIVTDALTALVAATPTDGAARAGDAAGDGGKENGNGGE